MIGIDTNILLRAVTRDDPAQSAKAAAFLERCTAARPGVINPVVLVECVWSLKRRYKAASKDIVTVVRAFLSNDGLRLLHADCAAEAASIEEKHPGSFTDAFIAALNREAGCASTASFDKKPRSGLAFTAL